MSGTEDFPLQRIPPENQVVPAQYGEGDVSDKLVARWRVYERALPYVDPLRQMYDMARELGVMSDATVLDVGCNDATDLIRLAEADFGHKGSLIGIDPYVDPQNPKLQAYRAVAVDGPTIFPIVGRIEDGNFTEGSFDLILAKFVLYHLSDPQAVLAQLGRLLTPEGVLMTATSGERNKPRHREFERAIAAYLQVAPPVRFNEKFTVEKAPGILREYFDIVEPYPNSLDLHYSYAQYNEADIGEYINSLLSMENSFHPRVDQQKFLEAIQRMVLPVIRSEIEQYGYFTETIDRRFFACKKKLDLR